MALMENRSNNVAEKGENAGNYIVLHPLNGNFNAKVIIHMWMLSNWTSCREHTRPKMVI